MNNDQKELINALVGAYEFEGVGDLFINIPIETFSRIQLLAIIRYASKMDNTNSNPVLKSFR